MSCCGNIGKMNKIISIKTQSNTSQDTFGQVNTSETFVAQNISASIEPLMGKEYYAAKQIQSEAEFKITIRYRAGITSNMTVEYGNRKFKIIGLQNPEERNRYLMIMCKEVI